MFKQRIKNHLFLLGSPRSGSTWLGHILSANGELNYVHEPDNERHSFMGYYAKQRLQRFPLLEPLEPEHRYHELFRYAFYQPYITYDSYSNQLLKKWVGLTPERVEEHLEEFGVNPNRKMTLPYITAFVLPKQIGNRNKRVVKSVHALMSFQFIYSQLENVLPLFIIRHPAAIVNSMLQMNNPDIDRQLYLYPDLLKRYPTLEDVQSSWPVEQRAGVQLSIFYREIEYLLEQYAEASLVQFEQISQNPFEESQKLYNQFGLLWNDLVEDFIIKSNQKGSGYETNRVSKNQADKWKKQLSIEQINSIKQGYAFLQPAYYQDFYV